MAKTERKQQKRGSRGWLLLPLWYALPVAAGLAFVFWKYGRQIFLLVQAACKVVVVR